MRSGSSAASCAPAAREREWCDPDVLRRLRRASLAALRREVEPAEQAALGRFLPSWHGIDRRASLREALVPLQGLALPVALWESDVLPRRVPNYQPLQLDQLCASGELVWVGAGLDRVAVYFREDAPVLGRPGAAERPDDTAHAAIRRALGRSAEFWLDLVAATGLEAEEVLPALWDLVWAGEVTNDAWTPLRAGRRYGVPSAPRRPAALLAPPRERDDRHAGPLVAHRPTVCRAARTGARWRSCCSSGRGSSPATASAPRACRAATGRSTASCGRSRRSASAAAATSSRASAAPSLRSAARSSGCASCARLRRTSWTRSCWRRPTRRSRTAACCRGRSGPGGRASRVAGAQVVLLNGEAALFVERGGKTLVPLREPDEDWLRPALAALVAHVKRGRGEAPGGGAVRRPAGGRHRAHAAARRGRLPRRPAPRGAPPVVRFVSVRLAASAEALPRLADFYGRDLGLGAPPYRVGETTIEFVPDPGEPFYHYALLVPGDRFDAALTWARDRVELLPGPAGNDVFDFDFWNARACYFHDPAGTIVELIAHAGVGEAGAEGPFRPEELLGLSELGLVGDPPALAAGLERLGLKVWSGSVTEPGSLAFVGGKSRTFILAAPGRGWLPTGRPAEQHPVETTVAAAVAGEVELDGSVFRIDSVLPG